MVGTDIWESFDIDWNVLWLKDYTELIGKLKGQWSNKEFYIDVEKL